MLICEYLWAKYPRYVSFIWGNTKDVSVQEMLHLAFNLYITAFLLTGNYASDDEGITVVSINKIQTYSCLHTPYAWV